MQSRKALLVGAGGWGRNWGKHLHSDKRVEVVGWVDTRPTAAEDAARKLGLENIYLGSDLEDAIGTTEPDFVVNLTVPPAHCEVTVQALEAGLPVLCEKPMADSMERAREMVAASERSGKLLMISQQRRYDRLLEATRRLIQDHVGPPAILNSDFYIAHPEAGFHVDMPSPLLLDMAIHTFDVARYIAGADPVAVYCEDFNLPWSWHTGNASATAIFEMTGGLRYTYRGSWSSQGASTSWEAEWRAVGPNGSAIWDGRSTPWAEVVKDMGVFPQSLTRVEGEADTRVVEGLDGSLSDFLHALDTGETPMGECHDNIKSLAMVFGALESASTGRRILIEDIL